MTGSSGQSVSGNVLPRLRYRWLQSQARTIVIPKSQEHTTPDVIVRTVGV